MAEPERFVVKEPDGDVAAVQESLGDAVEVAPLGDDLVVVTPREDVGGDRSDWWERIRDAVKSAEWVAPVVVDKAGLTSYPTGAVTVRFEKAPTEDDVREIEATYDLRSARQNEYVPEQYVFVPAEPRETFLPDLLARIDADPRVHAVWPVTMSRYARVDSR